MSDLRYLLMAAVVALCATSELAAHQFRFSAPLTGLDEATPNDSPGVGTALVTLDEDENTMRIQVSFSDLVGQVTSANIFGVTGERLAGTAIPVLQDPSTDPTTLALPDFPVGDSAGSYDRTINLAVDSTYNAAFLTTYGGADPQFQLGNALIKLTGMNEGLNAGEAYLSISTTEFPDGEIRGFPVYVPGDFNNNGVVDAADYTVWRDTLSQTGEGLDADFDNSNSIDEFDYAAWREHFGQNRFTVGPGSGGGAAVPEPASLMSLCIACALLPLKSWRCRLLRHAEAANPAVRY